MRHKLIELRKQAQKSQREVAEALGITRSFYGMIENGVRNPTLDLARKIAGFFCTRIDDVFFDDQGHDSLQANAAIVTECAKGGA